MTTQTNPNVRRISLGALKDNYTALRSCLPEGTKLIAVLKADAYGHGLLPAAKALADAGADMFAVALADEGVALRESGVTLPVLVLGPVMGEGVQQAVRKGLIMTVCTPESVQEIDRACDASGCEAQVHVKIDTGMNRLSCRDEEELIAVMASVLRSDHVRLPGACTHFAAADGGADYTRMQLERFRRMTALLPPGVALHCANSAAIHGYPEASFNMVRAGISLYGYPPVETDLPLRPCMTWETIVTHVKCVQAGECIGYGCTFAAPDEMSVATVACGYGDGYHRAASGRAEVLIGGRRCRVVGRICMDQMMVDVTGVPQVCAGDRVVLMGDMDGQRITADDIAAWADTIPYEILLGAPARVRRIYTE